MQDGFILPGDFSLEIFLNALLTTDVQSYIKAFMNAIMYIFSLFELIYFIC